MRETKQEEIQELADRKGKTQAQTWTILLSEGKGKAASLPSFTRVERELWLLSLLNPARKLSVCFAPLAIGLSGLMGSFTYRFHCFAPEPSFFL